MRASTWLLLIALVALAGCRHGANKPDLPGQDSAVVPEVVFVDRVRYVGIPERLTQEQPIAEGPLSQCPDVAAARKASLTKVNAQLREIGAVEGTEVTP